MVREYLIEKIGEKDAEAFCLWAFGEEFEDLDPLQLMKRWNRKHKNLMLLKGDSSAKADLLKMIEVWKKENA